MRQKHTILPIGTKMVFIMEEDTDTVYIGAEHPIIRNISAANKREPPEFELMINRPDETKLAHSYPYGIECCIPVSELPVRAAGRKIERYVRKNPLKVPFGKHGDQ